MEDFELEKLDDIEDEWINQIYEKEKELDKGILMSNRRRSGRIQWIRR